MNNRSLWLDQAKGLALIISIYFMFNKWLLIDFKLWSYGNNFSSDSTNFINYIEIFGRMSIIFLSALSFKFFESKYNVWFCKKFIHFILIPTVILLFGYEYIGLHWEFFQSLGIYFILFYLLKQVSSLFIKGCLSILTIAIVAKSMDLWPLLSSNFVGSLFFGNFTENNLFNIASGLPFVVVSSFLSDLLIVNKTLNISRLKTVTVFSGILLAIGVFLYQTSYFGGKVFFYPPHILEYMSGLFVGNLLVLLCQYLKSNSLALLGKHGLFIYWFSWIGSFILIDWNQIGLYQMTIFSAAIVIVLYVILLILINNTWGDKICKKIKRI